MKIIPINFLLKINFSKSYRVNRHGTKITTASIVFTDCSLPGNLANRYKIKCYMPKVVEPYIIFPSDFPDMLHPYIWNTYKEIDFEKMKKVNSLK